MDVNERESIKSVCVLGIECDWGTQGLVHWKLHAALATDAHGFTRIPDDREMLRGMVCRLDGVYTLRVR
jgi:hypothetical protein